MNPQLAQHLARAADEQEEEEEVAASANTTGSQNDAPRRKAADRKRTQGLAMTMQDSKKISGWSMRNLKYLFREQYALRVSVGVGLVSVVLALEGPMLRVLSLILGFVALGSLRQNIILEEKPTFAKASQDDLLRLQNESRLRIAALLGTIGAPLLQGSDAFLLESYSPDSVNTNPMQSSDLLLLEQLAETHVHLMGTVDEALSTLKQATSLRLGLGVIASASVERVEKAAIGRSLRRNRQGSGGSTANGLVLSLPRLRATLDRVIARQGKLLRTVVQDMDGLNEHDDAMGNIITLASLRIGRNKVVDLLSIILDRCSSSDQSPPETVRSKLERSIVLTNEASQHLLASLSFFPAQVINGESYLLQDHLSDLRSRVSALGVAVLGCQESVDLYTDETTRMEAAQWWVHVSNLLASVDSARHTVERELFPLEDPGDSGGVDLESDACDQQFDDRSTMTREEYSVDALQPSSHLNSSQHQVQGRKTYVFSGDGAVSPRLKCVEKAVSAREKPAPARYDPFMLIQELQTHLQAMPPSDEIEVAKVESSVNSSDSKPEDSLEIQTVCQTGVSGNVASMLLSELKALQVAIIPGEEESFQFEVSSL